MCHLCLGRSIQLFTQEMEVRLNLRCVYGHIKNTSRKWKVNLDGRKPSNHFRFRQDHNYESSSITWTFFLLYLWFLCVCVRSFLHITQMGFLLCSNSQLDHQRKTHPLLSPQQSFVYGEAVTLKNKKDNNVALVRQRKLDFCLFLLIYLKYELPQQNEHRKLKMEKLMATLNK